MLCTLWRIVKPLEQHILKCQSSAGHSEVSFGRVKNGGTDSSHFLSVRVLTCEGLADGSLRFHASWELELTVGEAPLRGDYRAVNLKWDGQNEGSLATALSEAVAGLAGEIAAAVKK